MENELKHAIRQVLQWTGYHWSEDLSTGELRANIAPSALALSLLNEMLGKALEGKLQVAYRGGSEAVSDLEEWLEEEGYKWIARNEGKGDYYILFWKPDKKKGE